MRWVEVRRQICRGAIKAGQRESREVPFPIANAQGLLRLHRRERLFAFEDVLLACERLCLAAEDEAAGFFGEGLSDGFGVGGDDFEVFQNDAQLLHARTDVAVGADDELVGAAHGLLDLDEQFFDFGEVVFDRAVGVGDHFVEPLERGVGGVGGDFQAVDEFGDFGEGVADAVLEGVDGDAGLFQKRADLQQGFVGGAEDGADGGEEGVEPGGAFALEHGAGGEFFAVGRAGGEGDEFVAEHSVGSDGDADVGGEHVHVGAEGGGDADGVALLRVALAGVALLEGEQADGADGSGGGAGVADFGVKVNAGDIGKVDLDGAARFG